MIEPSKLAHEMRLIKPVQSKSVISLVPYTPEYQKAYKQMYNACYHEMREALHIKPYDYIQDDSFFGDGMDSVYLLIEEGILFWTLEHITKEPIILHVADWNKRAIQLYNNCGFEITNTFEII